MAVCQEKCPARAYALGEGVGTFPCVTCISVHLNVCT